MMRMPFLNACSIGTVVRSLGCLVLLFFNFNVVQAQGQLWGMTTQGGGNDLGVIFKTNADGSGHVILKEFLLSSTTIGISPQGSLTMASNGKLYGMTTVGGSSFSGVLFEYDPLTSVYTNKLDFDGAAMGGFPSGSLTLVNGKLYGMTPGKGLNNWGTIFEYDPATNTFSKKYDFDPTGGGPQGSLTLASNGRLYGLTGIGGANQSGVLFEYDPVTSTYVKKIDFNGTTDFGSTGRGGDG